jgi:hypothetical protein
MVAAWWCWYMQPCAHCGLLMESAADLDLDHETDSQGRRTGRYLGLVHSKCNRSRGGKAGHLRQAAGRSAAEQADHNHRVAVRQRREAKAARAAMEQEEARQRLENPGPGRVW